MIRAFNALLKSTWLRRSQAIDSEHLTTAEEHVVYERAWALMREVIDTSVLLGESQLTGLDRELAVFLLRHAAQELAMINSLLMRAGPDQSKRSAPNKRWVVRRLDGCIGFVNAVRSRLDCEQLPHLVLDS